MPSCNTYHLGFLLPCTWGISSLLLQQSTAAAPYLGWGESPHSRPSLPGTWSSSSRPSCARATAVLEPRRSTSAATNWTCCLFYIYFRLWKRLDKSQIRVILLFKFKMGLKVAETTGNINNTIGPGTAKEHTVQWWFKKFRKGNRSLEDEECSDRIPKHRVLCSWKKQTYFLLAKTCWL